MDDINNLDDFFILKDGKLLDVEQARNIILENGGKSIQIYPRIRGGGILDMFESIFQIGKVFFFLLDLILWLVKFIAWFIMFVIAFLKFMFVDLIFDFYNSIVLIVVTLCKLPIDILGGLSAWVIDGIGGWMTTIWGWDQSNLTKQDKNSKYFKGIDRKRGRKCYLTNNNKVPFSILLGTIICPPMGVFMDMGLTGWLNILVCVILTLMFYIPGLVYALLVIYS
jgi:uncharacterized membrane protein YqaE (UPF0057 family)